MTWKKGESLESRVEKKRLGRPPGAKNKCSDETAFLFDQYGYNPLLELIEEAVALKPSTEYNDKRLRVDINKELCTYYAPKLKAVTIDLGDDTVKAQESWVKMLNNNINELNKSDDDV